MLILAFLLAVLQACQDNQILKPSCRVFKVDLIERWWYPVESHGGQFTKIFFTADGRIVKPFTEDSPAYTLENCNSIRVENTPNISVEFWTIKRLTHNELVITYDREYSITYSRNQ